MPEVLIGVLVVIGGFIIVFGVGAIAISRTPEEIGPNFKRLVSMLFFEDLPAALDWLLRAVLSFFPKSEIREGESK